jgi:hypothetical protein
MNNGTEERMELSNVIAIIPTEILGKVQKQLQKIGVKGVTVTQVRGYGEHKDLLREDWLHTHARIESRFNSGGDNGNRVDRDARQWNCLHPPG